MTKKENKKKTMSSDNAVKKQVASEKKKDKKINKNILSFLNKFKKMFFKIPSEADIANPKTSLLNINITKDGRTTLFIVFGVLILSYIIFGIGCISTIMLFLCLITIYFFRDPERVLPETKNAIISPCDGKILKIETASLPDELGGKDKKEYTKISVFMNIMDVHIQRIPVNCKVKQIEYIKGTFINATLDKASKDNERNIVLFERENGDNICVVQISGFISRRIVCHIEKEQTCNIGERYGMIKFGSRVEIYVPKNYKIEVLAGQRVISGETVVASF